MIETCANVKTLFLSVTLFFFSFLYFLLCLCPKMPLNVFLRYLLKTLYSECHAYYANTFSTCMFCFFFINIVCVKHRTTDMFENVSCSLSKCGKWSLKHFLLLNFAATCCRCWFSNHLLCIWCFSVFLIIGSYFASCMKADM